MIFLVVVRPSSCLPPPHPIAPSLQRPQQQGCEMKCPLGIKLFTFSGGRTIRSASAPRPLRRHSSATLKAIMMGGQDPMGCWHGGWPTRGIGTKALRIWKVHLVFKEQHYIKDFTVQPEAPLYGSPTEQNTKTGSVEVLGFRTQALVVHSFHFSQLTHTKPHTWVQIRSCFTADTHMGAYAFMFHS